MPAAFLIGSSATIIPMALELNLNNTRLFTGVSTEARTIEVVIVVVRVDDPPVLALFC